MPPKWFYVVPMYRYAKINLPAWAEAFMNILTLPKHSPGFTIKNYGYRYLDSMVENRMNSLYLWNGHPFASLVKLKDYPYAVEVDDSHF